MNKKHLTVADLERYFVNKVAQDTPSEKLFMEFASVIGARFVKFANRNPDAYGVLTDANSIVNIYYDASRDVYGFQALSVDGSLQSVLPLKNGCEIVDLFMRLAANIGKFAEQPTHSSQSKSKAKKHQMSDDESDDSSYEQSEYSDDDSGDSGDSRRDSDSESSEYDD